MESAEEDRYTELDLIQLVGEIVKRLPGTRILRLQPLAGRDLGFDLAFEQDGRTYLVDVRRIVPQTTERLRDIQRRLLAARSTYEQQLHHGDVRLVLAIPGVLADQKRRGLDSPGFELWDREWLTQHVVDLGLTGGIANVFGREYSKPHPGRRAQDLSDSLHSSRCGREDWSSYQRLCGNILEYLFCPPLEIPISQSSNEPRVNIRDFVIPNYATEGFWQFLRSRYRADYLVVDAKNHCEDIKKQDVLQLANYLSRQGTGLVGLIVTRSGIDSAGAYTCREQWIAHDKMIITLNDVDLLQMIKTKGSGDDPGTLIRQKIEDFRLGI